MDHGDTKGHWCGIGIVVLYNAVTLMMCQETLCCKLSLVAEAISLEKALKTALKKQWTILEIWTDSSVLDQCMRGKDIVPIDVYC